MAHAAVLRAHNRAQQKGSDPRLATCRGKLQNKRSKLNQEINKELRLRAGAENLYKATTNRKLKETVALELSFVNSNLQLLKEQLAELNSSVEIYQGESSEPVMPMIPLGLKETKEIDFTEPFKDFILEHYSEDGNKYNKAIQEFMDLRQSMRCPRRDESGIELLYQYYNQLYFVERRFFSPDRNLGIYFEWYDSFTGVPSCQRTVAFEKACVLFNIAALYTQLGARQNRACAKGLDKAVQYFNTAAGTLAYIRENFTKGPSVDLSAPMFQAIESLMSAQARECLFEKLVLQSKQRRDAETNFDLALEAQEVSKTYDSVKKSMQTEIEDYLPYSWSALVSSKIHHYSALSKSRASNCLVSSNPKGDLLVKLSDGLSDYGKKDQYKILRVAYLQKAIFYHEESARVQRMCRELRTKSGLTQVIERSLRASEEAFLSDSPTTLSDLVEPPEIPGTGKCELRPSGPDLGRVSASDLFSDLGPLAVFSALTSWSPPRQVTLQQPSTGHHTGYGFTITTDTPVLVSSLQPNSLAQMAGMKEGDFIVEVNEIDVKWSTHEQVVTLIKASKEKLTLKIVTPGASKVSRNRRKEVQNMVRPGKAADQKEEKGEKRIWNPFRKPQTEKNTISR
ncbi:rhophilin-2 isoform X2 [Cimex lectularius]|uniref:Rhophilin n=1 Tax=Cimex lectularius TaxID=79782 RepID=A0A8I6R9Q6_CIMLE|nr:rhophilin-2 isoform X2 [Cimex lectularius]